MPSLDSFNEPRLSFDEFLILKFEASNTPPHPFSWKDERQTLLEYSALLTRLSREYDRRSRCALLLRSGRSKFLESVAQELQEAGGTTFGFGLPSNHNCRRRVAQAFELSSISNGAGAPPSRFLSSPGTCFTFRP